MQIGLCISVMLFQYLASMIFSCGWQSDLSQLGIHRSCFRCQFFSDTQDQKSLDAVCSEGCGQQCYLLKGEETLNILSTYTRFKHTKRFKSMLFIRTKHNL